MLNIIQRIQGTEGRSQQISCHGRCWINLGEARMHQFKLMEGMAAVYEAWKLGDINSASRLLRAKVEGNVSMSDRFDIRVGQTLGKVGKKLSLR